MSDYILKAWIKEDAVPSDVQEITKAIEDLGYGIKYELHEARFKVFYDMGEDDE